VATLLLVARRLRLDTYFDRPTPRALTHVLAVCAVAGAAGALLQAFMHPASSVDQTVLAGLSQWLSLSLCILGPLAGYGLWLKRDRQLGVNRPHGGRVAFLVGALALIYALSAYWPGLGAIVPVPLLALVAYFANGPRARLAHTVVGVIALSYWLALQLGHPGIAAESAAHGLIYLQSVFVSILIGGLYLAAQSSERLKLVSDLKRREDDLKLITSLLSHDLKSPLVTVNGHLGLLKRRLGASRTEFANLLEPVERGVKRLTDVTLRLAAYLELGEHQLAAVVLSPHAVLAECAEELREALDAQLVTLELRTSTDTIVTDPLRTKLIVANLLANAVRHAQHNGRQATVVGRLDLSEGQIELIVEDTGVGIKTDQRRRIFDPTIRLEHTEGAGLGLHLVKTAIAELDGRIAVEVSSGLGGARFRAQWPQYELSH
jgi:signal transduction histidine kinase